MSKVYHLTTNMQEANDMWWYKWAQGINTIEQERDQFSVIVYLRKPENGGIHIACANLNIYHRYVEGTSRAAIADRITTREDGYTLKNRFGYGTSESSVALTNIPSQVFPPGS